LAALIPPKQGLDHLPHRLEAQRTGEIHIRLARLAHLDVHSRKTLAYVCVGWDQPQRGN
jgi:hypothetical protein